MSDVQNRTTARVWSRKGFRYHDSVYIGWGWLSLWIAGVALTLFAIIYSAAATPSA